jgi:hypothetical protein
LRLSHSLLSIFLSPGTWQFDVSSQRDQATGWTIRGSDFGRDNYPERPYILWGTCFGGYIPEIMRPGFEADHLPSSSASGKNKWSHNFTPLMFSWSVQGQHYFDLSEDVRNASLGNLVT